MLLRGVGHQQRRPELHDVRHLPDVYVVADSFRLWLLVIEIFPCHLVDVVHGVEGALRIRDVDAPLESRLIDHALATRPPLLVRLWTVVHDKVQRFTWPDHIFWRL